jgi:hypothetical protein
VFLSCSQYSLLNGTYSLSLFVILNITRYANLGYRSGVRENFVLLGRNAASLVSDYEVTRHINTS